MILSSEELATRTLEQSRNELLDALDEIDFDFPSFLGIDSGNRQISQETKLAAVWSKYAKKVCENERVRQLFENPSGDTRVALVCGIADLLAFSGAMTVAALVVKDGLHTWCAVYWRSEKSSSI